jgi:hypothetical protein
MAKKLTSAFDMEHHFWWVNGFGEPAKASKVIPTGGRLVK